MRKLLNGVWTTELCSRNGATLSIADHGAHVLSWIPADGTETLFLSKRSRYGQNDAIRGGVPIIFPQFNERGNGKRHGFARVVDWRLAFDGIENDRAVARYVLTQDDVPDTDWPHAFELTYEVVLDDQQLRLSLSAHNPSEKSWEFTAALHTYFQVSDVASIGLSGLQNVDYIEYGSTDGWLVQQQEMLHMVDPTDRIYSNVPETLTLHDGDRRVTSRQLGFKDAVVWNPGRANCAILPDLEPNAYKSFVCVEAAAVESPIMLAPGASWQGTQIISVQK